LDHLLHRFGPELICVLLAVAHKHLGHCHQLWQPDVYERLAGPHVGQPPLQSIGAVAVRDKDGKEIRLIK
ncbi:hypothetical protein, partial [Pseudoxanthomonas mexicana]|uniref:hypothetical protein n=1 Tax=Pseudoxanthomonas mexicana TaxID=128785 RepID=UPI001EE45F4D